LNNRNISSRLSKSVPPAISILGALIIFALSLGTYCLHYFPYEDDFSLIRYSAIQNSPKPETWITKGFSDYFANDPQCATRLFGFDRPVANATFYLESLLYRSRPPSRRFTVACIDRESALRAVAVLVPRSDSRVIQE
jgi:hypothetical protein